MLSLGSYMCYGKKTNNLLLRLDHPLCSIPRVTVGILLSCIAKLPVVDLNLLVSCFFNKNNSLDSKAACHAAINCQRGHEP